MRRRNAAREHVLDRRQIQRSLRRRNVGGIRHPQLVGTLGLELALDQIGGDLGSVRPRGAPTATSADSPEIVRRHQPANAATARPNAQPAQRRLDARRPVDAAGLGVDPSNPVEQFPIRRLPSRRGSLQPPVEAAAGDSQHAAHGTNAELGPVRLHELEDRLGVFVVSLANQAVAFARMSRSSLMRASSRRSRLTSFESSCSPGPSARSSQLRIVCGVGSNSSASDAAAGSRQRDQPLSVLLWIVLRAHVYPPWVIVHRLSIPILNVPLLST